MAGAVLILAAACGSNAPKGAKPPAAHPAASATTPAPDLSAELLAIGDLPAGWSVVPSSDSSSSTPQCLADFTSSLKVTGKAEVTFEGGSSGLPILDEELAYLPGQGQAAMAEFSRALSGCGHISITSDDTTLSGTVGAMSFPAVAEQSSAWQMNLTASVSGLSLVVGIDIVAFRDASTVGIILYGDLGTPGIGTVESVVQAAAAKVS